MVDATPEQALDPAAGDAARLAALRAGDDEVFAAVVLELHAAVVRTAEAYVHDRAVAEEVAQETWLAVVKGLDRFEGRSSLRTWILRITANQARTRARRERPTLRLAPFDAEDDEPSVDPSRFRAPGAAGAGHWLLPPVRWGPDAEQRLLSRELQQVISAALQTLPEAQRLVISLRDVEGWTTEEVCDALDITPGNQRVLLHRARSRVRLSLERYL